ncbi:MAG: hypothetical protein NTV89_11155 [Proteobacteria bacterium]|nr:hypothetical protein [Pseudomonadota bacterium]
MKSGRKKKDVTDEPRRFRELVRAMSDNFFDGHTEFKALNPEQKLQWLSACARFVYEAQQKKPSGRRKLPGS